MYTDCIVSNISSIHQFLSMTNQQSRIEYLYLSSNSAHPTVLNRLDNTEPSSFAVALTWDVIGGASTLDSMDERLVGTIEATHFMLDAALNKQVPSFDVMDSISVDASALHSTMFLDGSPLLPYTEEYCADVGDAVTSLDVLYLDTANFLDAPWGPEALTILIDNYLRCGTIAVAVAGLVEPQSSQEMTAALLQSSRLQEMGFSRVGSTPFFCLNTAYQQTALPAHLSLDSNGPVESAPAEAALVEAQ